MKRVGNLYNKICDIDVIMDMYDKVVKKKILKIKRKFKTLIIFIVVILLK